MCHSTVTSIGLRMAAPSETMIVVPAFLEAGELHHSAPKFDLHEVGNGNGVPQDIGGGEVVAQVDADGVAHALTRCAGMPSILAMFRSSL